MRSGLTGIDVVLGHVPREQYMSVVIGGMDSYIGLNHTFQSTVSLVVRGLCWRARGSWFESRDRQMCLQKQIMVVCESA